MTRERWIQELERPGEGFFEAFATQIKAPDTYCAAVQTALETLIPRIDWEGYLPQMPHGLLGLAAALQLEHLLAADDFNRLLATQLHAMACEGRTQPGKGLAAISKGSGHWPHVLLAQERHQPALAWGEIQGLARPESRHFQDVLAFVRHDMANLGHKAVFVHFLEGLYKALGGPENSGRNLLGVAAWEAAAGPVDHFWVQRIRKRLPEGLRVPLQPAHREVGFHQAAAQTVCEAGFVQLLDAMGAWMREGLGSGDLLAMLGLAAAEKMRDARRDLEGRTSWTLSYLATVAEALPELPEAWAQAAALINFFPSDEPEDRLQPAAVGPSADAALDLREAILDGEAALAMGWAQQVDGSKALREMAQTVTENDPGATYSAQVLAVAATARLLPLMPEATHASLRVALAKSLANSQGSGDLGRRAAQALK